MRPLLVMALVILLTACNEDTDKAVLNISEIDAHIKTILPKGAKSNGITKSKLGDFSNYSVEYSFNIAVSEELSNVVISSVGDLLDKTGCSWSGKGSGQHGYKSHLNRRNSDRSILIDAYTFKRINETETTLLLTCTEFIR